MAGIIANSALNPLVTGSLLYLLTKAPEQYRVPATNFLQTRLIFIQRPLQKIVTSLSTLVVLGIIRVINRRLNAFAMGHWQFDTGKSRWHWNSEIAVVTGGCQGIGRGTVAEMYAKGMSIAILDVAELPNQFKNKSRILYIKCDITSAEQVKQAADAIRARFGDPSVLVNNAGIQKHYSVLETPHAFIEKMIAVNLTSHYYTVQQFLPAMLKKNKGHIVGTASLGSFIGAPGVVGYTATKAAVLAFYEGLSSEIKHVYKRRGVFCTTVHPFWVDTPMVSQFEKEVGQKVVDPMMSGDFLGKQITNQIISCRGAQLVLPDRCQIKIATFLRALPNWVQEGLRDYAVTHTDTSTPVLARRFQLDDS